MKTSENINEIATALASAQAEIQNPAKTADNPFFKSKYADLAEVLSVVRPAFSKHKLNVVQMPYTSEAGAIGVTTLLSHASGQWMEGQLELPLQVAKNINQDAGTAITYMRRYALAAAAGVAQEDLDAHLGEKNTGKVTNLKVITKSQVSEITALIDETGSNIAGLLSFAGGDSIEQIPAANFKKVKDALVKKLEQSA
tara:strand:+ start:490 stop:1083 length:594 start_codon:yes stop_codon:yes gene_type:complete